VGYDDTSGQSPEFVFVSRGETVTNNINHYTLFNYGEGALTVTGITVSDGQSTYGSIALPCTIEPGAVETFTFSYGSGDGTITIESNDPDGDFSFNWSIPW